MKKYLFLIPVCLLLTSCGSVKNNTEKLQFKRESTLLDLRPLTSDGFFITESNSVGFDYQPIGVMTVYEYSGEDKTVVISSKDAVSDGKTDDSVYFKPASRKTRTDYRFADGLSALTELVRLAKKEGANGVINLHIKYDRSTYTYLPFSVEVSGMLIKK